VSRYASSAASVVLGAALAAVACGAKGGQELQSLTWTLIPVVLVGAVVIALAIARGRGGKLHGSATLLAFAALTVLTGLSLLWSIAPELSWIETNRTFAYLVAFAAAVAAVRLTPDGWAVVLRGILIAAGAVVVFALLSRVFPGSLTANEIYARLGQPYGYWNALGTTAALAVPPALWLGSRRSGHLPFNALAYPLISLITVALFLSYTRGALLAAGIAAVVWIAFVPLRLRSVTVLAVSLAGAAPVVAWALTKDAFTKNQVPLAVRQSVAGDFGVLLIAMCVVVLAVGLALGFRVTRRAPHAKARLRYGVAAGIVACAIPAGLFIAVATSHKGITKSVEAGVEQLTSASGKTPGGPSRLTTASSSRARYWREAEHVFSDHPVIGAGAGTFGVARLRYRNNVLVSRHAHGYVMQTLADLGLLGAALNLALLVAWLWAAARTIGLRRGQPFSAERVGLIALALAAIVFGLQSAIDWTWFVPGPAIMALVAAGYVAGRGPVTRRLADAVAAAHDPDAAPVPAAAPAAAPVAVGAAAGSGKPPPPPPGTARPFGGPAAEQPTSILPPTGGDGNGGPPHAGGASGRPSNARIAMAAAVVIAAAIGAWATWQPQRSDAASDRALDLAADGKYPAARAKANDAHRYNPLSPKPLLALATIDASSGHPLAAQARLQQAVRRFPADPQVWLRLADFQLNGLNHPADALKTVRGVLYLDPNNKAAQSLYFNANNKLHPPPVVTPAPAPAPAPGAAPAPTPTPTTPAPAPPSKAPAPPGD
jgi:O-antigen ligase